MAGARVFVSHSAKSAPHAELLERFVEEMKDLGLDPWHDRGRLGPGNDWNHEIAKALMTCHAGVILFSTDALNSDFVEYEVHCLALRRRTQPGFGLYPLLLDDTSVDEVIAAFKAIRLDDYQMGPLADGKSVVLTKLCDLDTNEPRPTGAIEDAAFRALKDVSAPALVEAAAELDWDAIRLLDDSDAVVLHFVRQLLASTLETQMRALNLIVTALPKDQNIVSIFDKLAPCWVDEHAAVELDRVRQQPEGKRGAMINGLHGEFSCTMFLKRAKPTSDPRVVPAGTQPRGRLITEDLLHQVRMTLAADCGVLTQTTSAEIDGRINVEVGHMATAGEPPTYPLQLEEWSLSSLSALMATYPGVVFVAMTGDDLPEVEPPLSQGVARIEPPLRKAEDDKYHNETYAYGQCARRERLLRSVPRDPKVWG